MKFIPDPSDSPCMINRMVIAVIFWVLRLSVYMLRMIEDVNFSVLRKNVHGDRVFIDAKRTSPDDGETRLSVAYGSVPVTLRGQNPDDSKAWKIF